MSVREERVRRKERKGEGEGKVEGTYHRDRRYFLFLVLCYALGKGISFFSC